MALITLVARPFFTGLHNLLVNQAIVPGLSNRSRWLMHNYVVRQSLGFSTTILPGVSPAA